MEKGDCRNDSWRCGSVGGISHRPHQDPSSNGRPAKTAGQATSRAWSHGCTEVSKAVLTFGHKEFILTHAVHRKILAQGGVAALWRGCWPNVQRAALVNLGDLSTYDSVKRAILKNTTLQDNSLTHCLSSGCAG